jgi:hypothetical protein
MPTLAPPPAPPRRSERARRTRTQAEVEDALEAWCAAEGGRHHFVSCFGEDLNWAPDLVLAHRARRRGAVILRLGHYEPVVRAIAGCDVAILERTGGRWAALTADRVAITREPVTAVFGGRDPDGTPWLLREARTDACGIVTFPTATLPRLPGGAYLEGWTVVRPRWTVSAEGGELVLDDGGRVRRWTLPGGRLGDVQLTPAGDAVFFAMRGSRTIWRADVATGVIRRHAIVPAPVRRLTIRGDRVVAGDGAPAAARLARSIRATGIDARLGGR